MRKYFLFILVTISSIFSSSAQENINMVKILGIEQDIISLEARITKLIKKKSEISNLQGLKQFHILWLGSKSTEKEDFLDYSFLYHLMWSYYYVGSNFLFFHKTQTYITTSTLITDSIGNLIAYADALLVHVPTVSVQEDIRLAKMFFDKEIDFAFCLASPFSMQYMVGIKGNDLYAFENTKEGLKIYTWEEFMTCCFDEWQHKNR